MNKQINLFENEFLELKSLEKGIDEKMFGLVYLLKMHSGTGDLEWNVDDIIDSLICKDNKLRNKMGHNATYSSIQAYHELICDSYYEALTKDVN